MSTGFNGLPMWAKGTIAVVATGVSAFALYRTYKYFQDRAKAAGSRQETNDVKGDIKDLGYKNVKPSYSDSQYSSWANKIFEALDGYETDELAVYSVLSNMKNDADVLKLIDAYGIREVSSGVGNPTPNFKGTLSGALTSEFNAFEMIPVNNILKNRGIKFRF